MRRLFGGRHGVGFEDVLTLPIDLSVNGDGGLNV